MYWSHSWVHDKLLAHPSNMPCSRCGSWETNPSWHRCDKANSQGVVKLHTGDIRCSRSWDGTYWFFFCNHCKASRPHIIGVLRNARIWHCPYSGQTDYITDSEGPSYDSSESESCTQETEDFFSIHEAARAKSPENWMSQQLYETLHYGMTC